MLEACFRLAALAAPSPGLPHPKRGCPRPILPLAPRQLLMTALAVATVDSWGRRPLLLWGVSGIVAALLALGAAQVGWWGARALA